MSFIAMEKKYQLRAIEGKYTPEFLILNASIYLNERLIGKVKTCLDSKTMSFDFGLAMDRIVFENFVVQWWKKEDRTRFLSLRELATKLQNPKFVFPTSAMMCTWVRSITFPALAPKKVNLLAVA